MPQFISIPSVIERQNKPITQLTAPLDKRLQLFESGAGYLVGNLALSQGLAPYRNINSSPASIDYQLLAKAGLLVASGAKSGELVLTIGFPSAVYDLYKQQAEDFFALRDVMIDYQLDTINSIERGRTQLTITHLEITSEILGCINGLRKGPQAEADNFFIVSLGYGTCETALSTTAGPVARTCMSAPGLRYAVNNLYQELSGSYYLGMKNEHMINQGFQKGEIVIDRKRKDLLGLRRNHLAGYYEEILSPTFRKAFTDSDYEQASKLYLVGGGALYPELLELFQREFDGVLDIIVPEDAGNTAAMGYYHRSAQWCGPNHTQKAVGLDIGNAYTVIGTPSAAKVENTVPITNNNFQSTFSAVTD
ncbi:hypothetical protein FAZ19_11850 [Sphingobacterium alkalisoli]|uniref:HTH cro/C1-type domain-containing protein n=1 Tax=Sphingobacterium alkalisoli TaxID=1874115 RepID=A0A4U0H2T7_9SPHI|nr:hypothetical protein [Sphingobacterium alkalisoli]TJY65806.1 hypothetical protein FAZ19_11850 [Sphingobacterium alkalisoli]GGH18203.1 hypothetical protein GCM10011418_21680 [Sphingobacterium alkalisoli]